MPDQHINSIEEFLQSNNEVSDPAEAENIVGTEEIEGQVEQIDTDNKEVNNDGPLDDKESQLESNPYEYPKYIPDEYKPGKFENTESELKFYRDNYNKIIDISKSKEFIENFADEYQDHLIARENNVNELKAISEAMKGTGGAVIAKMFFKDALQKEGYSAKIGKDEAEQFIADELARRYGADWEKNYKTIDELDASTLSGKIFREKSKLINAFTEQNNSIETPVSEISEEERQTKLNEEYIKSFKDKGMEKSEFDNFVIECREKLPGLSLMDYHQMIHFDDYVVTAYEKGLQEGREQLRKDIDKSGSRIASVNNPFPEKDDSKEFTIEDLYKVNSKGRL